MLAFLLCLGSRTSLVVQWLRLCVFNAGGLSSIPGQGTRSHMWQLKIPHATTKTQQNQIDKNKEINKCLKKKELKYFPRWLSVKNPPVLQETQVQSPGWEDPLEEEMATHSSILAWKIPWTGEPGGLQSMGSQSQTRLSNYATKLFLHRWVPLFSFLPLLTSSCLGVQPLQNKKGLEEPTGLFMPSCVLGGPCRRPGNAKHLSPSARCCVARQPWLLLISPQTHSSQILKRSHLFFSLWFRVFLILF